jgi:hypothetical protein
MKPIAEQVASVKKGSKILICGNRRAERYIFFPRVYEVVSLTQPSLLICGGASGVDSFANEAAYDFGIAIAEFAANWEQHGRHAGPIRNGWMLRFGQPDYVIAFPGGKGTENMVMQAEEAGVPVIRIVLEES